MTENTQVESSADETILDEAEQKQYELMFLVPGSVSEEEAGNILKRVKKELSDFNADILHEEAWSKRNLAYKVNKENTGYYFVLNFKVTADKASEIDNFCRIDRDIIRHLLTLWPEDQEMFDYSNSKIKFGEPVNPEKSEEEEKPKKKIEKKVEVKEKTAEEKPAVIEDEPEKDKEEVKEEITEEKVETTPEVVEKEETKEKPDEKDDENKLDKFLDDIDNLEI